MPPTLRSLPAVAVLATLLCAGPVTADEPAALWIPEALRNVHVAVAKGSGKLFVVVRDVVDTAAAVTYPVIDLHQPGPSLHAILRSTGERGALRPHALSTARAQTDPFLGIALFAGRDKYTSAGGAEVFGLEGGAAIRVLEQVDFTARYRMLSYDGLMAISAPGESEVSAPLFGFALRF